MLRRLLNRLSHPIADPGVETLYRVCVAQARHPVFYAGWQVPDTVDGRFDLLILHAIMLILRLADYPVQTQQLFDILFADMDKNLRQMGVSDMGMARKMKPLLAAFYGRATAYDKALKGDDAALAEALRRNIYGASAPSPDALRRLTAYVRASWHELAATDAKILLSGSFSFPTLGDAS